MAALNAESFYVWQKKVEDTLEEQTKCVSKLADIIETMNESLTTLDGICNALVKGGVK